MSDGRVKCYDECNHSCGTQNPYADLCCIECCKLLIHILISYIPYSLSLSLSLFFFFKAQLSPIQRLTCYDECRHTCRSFIKVCCAGKIIVTRFRLLMFHISECRTENGADRLRCFQQCNQWCLNRQPMINGSRNQ